MSTAIVLLDSPLKERLAASLTDFVYRHRGKIVAHDQYVDHEKPRYFARIEWDLADFDVPRERIGDVFQRDIAEPFAMRWSLHFSDDVPRIAVFVSKLSYCLYDILARVGSGEWRAEVPVIVSNHPDLEPIARRFGIEFRRLPITPRSKAAQEREELRVVRRHGVELVVLARYMQIVGRELIAAYPNRIINIHHAFLPAFPGAKPYHAAHARGVKIIGATSHYVTEDLDAGPIIEQDVVRASHASTVDDLLRMGRDLEKIVLSRAIWSHLQRKVIVHDGRTVVFG